MDELNSKNLVEALLHIRNALNKQNEILKEIGFVCTKCEKEKAVYLVSGIGLCKNCKTYKPKK